MRLLTLESQKSQKLAKIATDLFMKSPVDKRNLLKIVDKFLRDKFIYASETIETLISPDYMLSGLEVNGVMVGDCDDISTLHAALLTALGFQVRFVAIRSVREDVNYDHVYIEVKYGEEWTMFDLTLPLGSEIEFFGRVAVQV